MTPSRTLRVGVLVPTRNAGATWPAWIRGLQRQVPPLHRVLVMDTASSDQTVALAHQAGFEVEAVDPYAFDHGGTRQLGLQRLGDCDIVVCLTQDAMLEDADAIAKLVAAFEAPTVAVAWGRQLPHHDANPIARHARAFNYPAESRTVSIDDAPRLGIKVGFCSNSFCAWRREALQAVGGFPAPTLLAEDMLAALALLKAGYQIAYVPAACVRHSHNFGVVAEFRRYFDTGVTHRQYAATLACTGSPNAEGLRFVRSEWRALGRAGFGWRLRALCQTAAKWLGYQLGKHAAWLPLRCARALSSHSRWPGWQHGNPRRSISAALTEHDKNGAPKNPEVERE